MTYPSTLTSFSNPLPTDRLNSPSHSSIETAQNTELTQIQTYIGVTNGANASVEGTLLYDIKSPASDGGGHIQSASKGGTGQTSYNKGDILVAQSSSVISKLTVGSNGLGLVADNTTATGVKWGFATGVIPSAATVIPQSPIDKQYAVKVVTGNPSLATVGQVYVNSPITANRLTVLSGDQIPNPGTIDLTLYEESGARSVFAVTTPTISVPSTLYTTTIPSVILAPGNYYIMANPNAAGDIRLMYWATNREAAETSIITLNYVSSMPVLQGTYLIPAGAPPASIRTTGITSVVSAVGSARFNTLVFRLDT